MTDTNQRWLTPDEQAAWRALIGSTKRLLARLDTELQIDADIGLDEYEVLVHLSESGSDRLRMSELADRLHVSRSNLSHRVRRMTTAGYVERVPCTTDGRGTFAVLTPLGSERLVSAAPNHVDAVRLHFIEHLSPDSMAVLTTTLESISTKLGSSTSGETEL